MTKDYDTNDDGVKLHLRESEALRKQWVTYVFDAVQSLHDKVAANSLQLQKEREEVFHKLVELKEKLDEQIKDSSKEQAKELEKLDKKLTTFIQEVADGFSNVNTCVDDCLSEQSDKNAEVSKELKIYLDTELDKINDKVDDALKKLTEDVQGVLLSQTTVKAKLGVYIALITLGTTTVFGVLATSLIVMFKDALKAWLG